MPRSHGRDRTEMNLIELSYVYKVTRFVTVGGRLAAATVQSPSVAAM